MKRTKMNASLASKRHKRTTKRKGKAYVNRIPEIMAKAEQKEQDKEVLAL